MAVIDENINPWIGIGEMTTVKKRDDSFEDEEGESAFLAQMMESSQIGVRLANEVRQLREELLASKQQQRILLVSNGVLQEELGRCRSSLKSMREEYGKTQALLQQSMDNHVSINFENEL